MENQLNQQKKIIRGWLYVGECEPPLAEKHLKYSSIYQTTSPYTPQSNRFVERKNTTLKKMIIALIIHSGSP